MNNKNEPKTLRNWRGILHEVIFEADTATGKAFDVFLFAAICLSIFVITLDSLPHLHDRYGSYFRSAEWIFTGLFTVEYILRLVSLKKPAHYAKSFFGVVDLLAILPAFLSILIPHAQGLLVIRSLRLLRIFRVMKLIRFVGEASVLREALLASSRKITVFLLSVTIMVFLTGAIMHLIEFTTPGFQNIPSAVYWAIVTVTTVGYGDVVPITFLGKSVSSLLMIFGFAIIAVPTGILTVELSATRRLHRSTQACPACSLEGHDDDAKHCKFCGEQL